MEENKPKEELSPNSESDPKSDDGNIIADEILEGIPEEERGRVASIIKQTMISAVTRRSNPLADKITSEHISQLITKSDDQDKRDRQERKSERSYNLILVFLTLLFVVFLIVYLKANEDLLLKVIIAIISFIGGFGFGKSKLNI